MELDKFLALVGETLDYEGTIGIEDNVSAIEVWDSLGILSIVAMLDEMGFSIDLDQFEKIKTIRQFVDIVGIVDDSSKS